MSENGGQLRCNSEPATTPRQVNLTLFWPCPAHSGAERNADFHLRALCRVENQHVVSDAPRPAVKPCPGLRNTSHAPDQIGRGWLSALFDRRRGSHGNTHFLRRVGDSGKIEEVGVEPSRGRGQGQRTWQMRQPPGVGPGAEALALCTKLARQADGSSLIGGFGPPRQHQPQQKNGGPKGGDGPQGPAVQSRNGKQGIRL